MPLNCQAVGSQGELEEAEKRPLPGRQSEGLEASLPWARHCGSRPSLFVNLSFEG